MIIEKEPTHLLKQAGIIPTKHRVSVLDILAKSKSVLTAKDILRQVREASSMDKVTMYRTLDLLVIKGLIRKIATLQGAMVYEFKSDDGRHSHPHFVCKLCGDSQCLEELNVLDFNSWLNQNRAFNFNQVEIKIEGVCDKCQT